jgi:hypothetical protein
MSVLALLASFACMYADSGAIRAYPSPLASTLSSLKPGCNFHRVYTGFLGGMSELLVLRCRGVDFTVSTPNNLIGHVEIATRDQALEYVRFFTTVDSQDLFDLGGLTEIVPGSGVGEFYQVPPEVFAKYFKPVSVQESYESAFCQMHLKLLCGKSFDITRPMLDSEGRALELSEVIFHTGFRYVRQRTVVLEHAETIGLDFFGPL